jgi:FG-GAP-like repeat
MKKFLLPILVLAFTACNQNQIANPVMPSHPRGLIEINFSEIGNAQPNSSAKNLNSSIQTRSLSDNGGGIDMKLVSTNAFTFKAGVNRQDGFRYLSATYKIRNANSTGTLYGTPRNNLSFIAVSTTNTIGGSAVSSLIKFDGTPADSNIAPLIRPTHEMTLDSNTLTPKTLAGKEDFQAYLETEIAQFQPGSTNAITGVTSVFGYGFVTRTIGNPSSRILASYPIRSDGYDGIVTFAVRVPLQAGPNGASKDPFSFSMMFEVMDDSNTSVTQSLEEQADPSNVLSRSALLKNAPIKTLPGSNYSGIPVCQVRTAGTLSNPLAFMVNSSHLNGTPALANQMFVPAGGSINANFDQVMNAAGDQTFSVSGSMTGQKTGNLSGAGTNKLSFTPTNTSSAAFPPNEEIEVTLTGGLKSQAGLDFCPRYSFHYHTAVNVPSTASFSYHGYFYVGRSAYSIISADLNNDGNMDLISTSADSSDVSIRLGKGNGDFQTDINVRVGSYPISVVAFDLNHDHNIDLVTTNLDTPNLSVLLGDGTGHFATRTDIASYSTDTAIADFNSDGHPDLVTANLGAVSVFLGNGDGSFKPSIPTVVPGNFYLTSIKANDLNNDGKMDVVVGNNSSTGIVVVLLGNGDGRFHETAQPTYVHPNPFYATTSDFNNDGNLDLIAVENSQTSQEVSVSLGNGDGSFQAAIFKPIGLNLGTFPNPTQAISADINGDGKMDIVTNDRDANLLTVLLGNGDGTLQDPKPWSVNERPISLTASDLNNDGKLDLVSAGETSFLASVLLQ